MPPAPSPPDALVRARARLGVSASPTFFARADASEKRSPRRDPSALRPAPTPRPSVTPPAQARLPRSLRATVDAHDRADRESTSRFARAGASEATRGRRPSRCRRHRARGRVPASRPRARTVQTHRLSCASADTHRSPPRYPRGSVPAAPSSPDASPLRAPRADQNCPSGKPTPANGGGWPRPAR